MCESISSMCESTHTTSYFSYIDTEHTTYRTHMQPTLVDAGLYTQNFEFQKILGTSHLPFKF
jgi:hypothetical protein